MPSPRFLDKVTWSCQNVKMDRHIGCSRYRIEVSGVFWGFACSTCPKGPRTLIIGVLGPKYN